MTTPQSHPVVGLTALPLDCLRLLLDEMTVLDHLRLGTVCHALRIALEQSPSFLRDWKRALRFCACDNWTFQKWYVTAAVMTKNRRLLEFFLWRTKASFLNHGLKQSAMAGDWSMVHFFMLHRAHNWQTAALWAAKGGRRDMWQWFSNKASNGDWTKGSMRCFLRSGDLVMTQHCLDCNHLNDRLSRRYAEYAAHSGTVKTIAWATSVQLAHEKYEYGFTGASKGGHMHLMRWFADLGATTDNAYWIIWNGHLGALQWLCRIQERPISACWIRLAMTAGQMHIVRWLVSRYPFDIEETPSKEDLCVMAVQKKWMESAVWFIRHREVSLDSVRGHLTSDQSNRLAIWLAIDRLGSME